MFQLSMVPGCVCIGARRDGSSTVVISARSRHVGACCPDCRRRSSDVHGYYDRQPDDLPVAGRRVRLELRVRRYACRNVACSRRTFAERHPMLIAPLARRTKRLATAQARIGIALGGAPGSRLGGHLAMPTSHDTMLRLVRRIPLPILPEPTAIGIDDWAMKKRLRYGTIIVDLERHRPIDLLPDRTAPVVVDWLRERNGIEVVARDRSTEYKRAIVAGAPDAMQVADRWHLLFNVRQMVERWAIGAHARLRHLPLEQTTGLPKPARTKAFPRTTSDRDCAADSRSRRWARYDDVRRRFLAGETLRAITRSTRLARATVHKFAHAESFPERATHSPKPSMIDPYLPLLEARLAEGCENGLQLWRECQDQGYPGTHKQIHRWLQDRRSAPSPHTPKRAVAETTPSMSMPPSSPLPSPKQLAWLIVKAPDTRAAEETCAIRHISQDPDADVVIRLARRFVDLVRRVGIKSCNAGAAFDEWLLDAKNCGVRPLETFASGLEKDGAAVRAALRTAWSNAQAEGQITKLKLLKRSMYGRGKIDLLRQRLLLAA